MAGRSTTYLAASWTLGIAACGVDVAGILSDAGLPPVDAGGHVIADASRDGTAHAADAGVDVFSHVADAMKQSDAKVDAGTDASPRDSGEIDAFTKDATPHDSGEKDAGEEEAGAKEAGGEDSGPKDGGHDDAPHGDASADAIASHDGSAGDAHAKDASADAPVVTPPPPDCFFSYSCGSATCGCNQTCDNHASCGACLPGYATCGLDIHDCDTSLSGLGNCGSCGNICTCPLGAPIPSCLPSGNTWECHCAGL